MPPFLTQLGPRTQSRAAGADTLASTTTKVTGETANGCANQCSAVVHCRDERRPQSEALQGSLMSVSRPEAARERENSVLNSAPKIFCTAFVCGTKMGAWYLLSWRALCKPMGRLVPNDACVHDLEALAADPTISHEHGCFLSAPDCLATTTKALKFEALLETLWTGSSRWASWT